MHKTDIKDQAVSIASEIAAAVGAVAGETKTQVEALAREANAKVEYVYGGARDQVRGATASVAALVWQQPLFALLVAGLIGFTAGLLVGRR